MKKYRINENIIYKDAGRVIIYNSGYTKVYTKISKSAQSEDICGEYIHEEEMDLTQRTAFKIMKEAQALLSIYEEPHLKDKLINE